jgi:hypothetical protein
MGETHLLGLISPTIISDDCVEEDDEEREEEEDDKENDDSDAEFEIPRSMREIYKVSNRNRRNKKTSASQTAEREVAQGKQMDVDTLEGADAVIAARGSGYFDNANSKRQKHDEGEEEQQQVSQDEDIAFMQQIGWVKDKEEAETLKPRPREDSEDFDAGTEQDDTGKQQAESKQDSTSNTNTSVKPFDYSTVGNIGVYDPNAPAAANPFFAGAAVAGSGFNQGSSGPRRDNGKAKRGGKRSGRGGGSRQERPQKNDGRSFVYKKK